MQDGFDITELNILIFGFNIYSLSNNGDFVTNFNVLCLVYFALELFLFIPVTYGVQKYFYNVSDGRGTLSDLFSAYKDGFGKIVVVNILNVLFIVLGMIMFVIPGIVIAFTYYFVNLVMLKYPELSIKEVFGKAKSLSKGIRFELFVLLLSFIGVHILYYLTYNILMVFVIPYTALTLILVFKALVEESEYSL